MARTQGLQPGFSQAQAYSEKQDGNGRLYLEPVGERTPAAACDPAYFENAQYSFRLNIDILHLARQCLHPILNPKIEFLPVERGWFAQMIRDAMTAY